MVQCVQWLWRVSGWIETDTLSYSHSSHPETVSNMPKALHAPSLSVPRCFHHHHQKPPLFCFLSKLIRFSQFLDFITSGHALWTVCCLASLQQHTCERHLCGQWGSHLFLFTAEWFFYPNRSQFIHFLIMQLFSVFIFCFLMICLFKREKERAVYAFCYQQIKIFYFFLSVFCNFLFLLPVFFSSFIALSRTYSIILNRSEDSGHFSLFHNIRGKMFSNFITEYDICSRILINTSWEKGIFIIGVLLRIFIKNSCWLIFKWFFTTTEIT